MIGGKQVTVQMASSNKTLTLVQPQQGVSKIVRLPMSSATSTSSEQPKLMVVSRPKPTATIGKCLKLVLSISIIKKICLINSVHII